MKKLITLILLCTLILGANKSNASPTAVFVGVIATTGLFISSVMYSVIIDARAEAKSMRAQVTNQAKALGLTDNQVRHIQTCIDLEIRRLQPLPEFTNFEFGRLFDHCVYQLTKKVIF